MLAELAAANAAFSIIKETINNGGDILAAGQHLFGYFDNKAAIQKKAKDGGMKSDLEEFMALEQLKKQEHELREMMIYQGRGGMWDDWMQFQVEARKKREKAEAEERLKREQRIEALKNGAMIVALVVMLGGIGVIIGLTVMMATGRL